MIQAESVLNVADNSGAKEVYCIHVNGSTGLMNANIGDLIKVSVKTCIPNGPLKKGEIYLAVIVRTVKSFQREDGSSVRFDDNAVVLVDAKSLQPIGTRVMGPVGREVRAKGFTKIISLATEVF